MTDGRSGWNPQAWRGYPERVGNWWTLKKGSRTVVCDIYTHPLGGELRCDVDSEMFGTRASRTLDDLLAASDEWRKAFEGKGWAN